MAVTEDQVRDVLGTGGVAVDGDKPEARVTTDRHPDLGQGVVIAPTDSDPARRKGIVEESLSLLMRAGVTAYDTGMVAFAPEDGPTA